MNQPLFDTYRAAYEQCFVPIFVRDAYDTETLLEGCRLAGVKAIEYTLRREDAHEVIPTLKKRLPGVRVFVGSTMDAPEIVRGLRAKFPQLMTIDELATLGVDGFVSMLAFSDETIARYRGTHLLIPSADTANEALRQMRAGAHVIKVSGEKEALMRECRAAPAFGFCPLFATGGVTLARMTEIFKLGVVLTASGFDLTLRGIAPEDLTPEIVRDKLVAYRDTAIAERAKAFESLRGLEALPDAEWLARLPHYHPFG